MIRRWLAQLAALFGELPAPPWEQCRCSPPAYDGDDGWSRDCPVHGVEAER